MLDLFRVETENQTGVLTAGLLELERGDPAPQQLETLMRAAHSLKGAARIVNLGIAVKIAHAMEDFFVAAQKGIIQVTKPDVDQLLKGVDLLLQSSKPNEAEIAAWEKSNHDGIQQFLAAMSKIPGKTGAAAKEAGETPPASPTDPPGQDPTNEKVADPIQVPAKMPEPPATVVQAPPGSTSVRKPETPERVLRLNAENLNRLLGLAGESLVESRWLRPFAESLQRLKRHHSELAERLDDLRQSFAEDPISHRSEARLQELFRKVTACQEFLSARIEELDQYDRRSAHLSHRLYLEVLRSRMRPFADGANRFPRMVRDLARSLGKEVKLEIIGENTQVDRDILERLETPLAHLLRNAVDHGCETPEERVRQGKPAEATIRLEARHSAGLLLVTVSDDGAGLDPERVRRSIVQKRLTMSSVADKLTESELLEFLFLPGFTLKDTVTEISGRGVGLDIVQNMVKSVRGAVRISTQPGRGMRFQLHLPLTLSVLRTLLVEIGGEPYAIPLSQITRALKLPFARIQSLEGRHHFQMGDHHVGLLAAHQVLDCAETKSPEEDLPVVVLGDRSVRYGLVVDRFLGQRELVVQPLDSRLGKVKDISAAALMEDGSPVLILDIEDMVRSIEKLISGQLLANVQGGGLELQAKKKKRVLAVDDSLTVRELERKLLLSRGYHAEVAIDGMDGWNALRSGEYDLVITDVDMPRMDGIELTTLIKKDPQLKSLPVLIVSYKDREEDRLRGLEAGADYYLTKGSFHDETLIQAVTDLIGGPAA